MKEPANGERRFVLTAVWISFVLAFLLLIGIFAYSKLRPQMVAENVRNAAQQRDYVSAAAHLEVLKDLDSRLYYDEVLAIAKAADENAEWEYAKEVLQDAIAQGEEGETYEVFLAAAEERILLCTYHEATACYESGDYIKASRLAATINRYEPAQRLYELSYQAYLESLPTPEPTAIPTPPPTPEPSSTPTPEPTSTPEPIPEPTAKAASVSAETTVWVSPTPSSTPTPAPTNTPAPTPTPAPTNTPAPTPTPMPQPLDEGRVAVGYHHAVFLKDDGTVLAYGDNTYGQLNVGEWTNVKAVAAGAYHTVALTQDGHMLATGDNRHGQTDVSLFADVRQIAANAWNTFALLGNGQVISVGYNTYDFTFELSSAERIFAGSYGLVVRSGGENHSSHPGLVIEDECLQLSLSRGYVMGIMPNGCVSASGIRLPEWTEVSHISAGENAALALTKDGRVLSCAFGAGVHCTFDFGQPVLAICAGPNQYAFVLADGSVEIRHSDGTAIKPQDKLW